MNEATAEALTSAIHKLVERLDAPGCNTEPGVLNIAGVAELLGITAKTVRKMDLRGQLPSPIRIGARKRWLADELRRWLAAGAPPRDAWDAVKR